MRSQITFRVGIVENPLVAFLNGDIPNFENRFIYNLLRLWG